MDLINKNNSAVLISGGFIQNPGEQKQKKNIFIQKDKIVNITEDVPSNAECIDASGCIITPGIIDQHIHGGYGCNFNTADTETVLNFLSNLPRHGVTSICPTIMTDTPERIRTQIKIIRDAKKMLPENSAKILGINLEGPFLNPAFKGIHSEELFLEPTIANYKNIESEEIKIITIAPELDKDFELTKYLSGKGIIVSAGHSKADETEFSKAVDVGLTQVTHIFNAMPPLHHRKPGITGNSLVNDFVNVEVIADHNHLHPDIIKLILRSKPQDKVIFISDSLPLNQSESNSTVFGGQEIFKQGEIAVNKEGKLAGSLLFLDSIIRKNLVTTDFSDLLLYCSLNPAKNLGIGDLGYIKKDMTADLVIWDDKTFEIKAVIVNGNIAHNNLSK